MTDHIIQFLQSIDTSTRMETQDVMQHFRDQMRDANRVDVPITKWNYETALLQLCVLTLCQCKTPSKVAEFFVTNGTQLPNESVLWGYVRGFTAKLLLRVHWKDNRFVHDPIDHFHEHMRRSSMKLKQNSDSGNVLLRHTNSLMSGVAKGLNVLIANKERSDAFKDLHKSETIIEEILNDSFLHAATVYDVVEHAVRTLKAVLQEHASNCYTVLQIRNAIFGLDDIQNDRLVCSELPFTELIYRIRQRSAADSVALTNALVTLKETMIVGGDSGTGKTTFLLHLADKIRSWHVEGKSTEETDNTVCITTMLRPSTKPGAVKSEKEPKLAVEVAAGGILGVINVEDVNDRIEILKKDLHEFEERKKKYNVAKSAFDLSLHDKGKAQKGKTGNEIRKMKELELENKSLSDESFLSSIHQKIMEAEGLTDVVPPKLSTGTTSSYLPQLSVKQFTEYAKRTYVDKPTRDRRAWEKIIRNAVWSYHIFNLVKKVLGDEVFGLLQGHHKLCIVFVLGVDEAGGYTDMCHALCASKDWIEMLIVGDKKVGSQVLFYLAVAGTGVNTSSLPPGSLPSSYNTVTCVDTGAHVLRIRLQAKANGINDARIEKVLTTISAHSFLRDVSNNARLAALLAKSIDITKGNGPAFFFRDDWVAGTLLPQLALAAVAEFRTRNSLVATDTDDVLWILWNCLQLFLFPTKQSNDIVELLACTFGVVTDTAVWKKMSRNEARKKNELWDSDPSEKDEPSDDIKVDCLVTPVGQSRITGNCSSFAILISLWLAEVLESSVNGEGMEKSGMFTQLLWALASQGMPMDLALDALRTGKPQFRKNGAGTLFPTLTLSSVRYPADTKELERYLKGINDLNVNPSNPSVPVYAILMPPKLSFADSVVGVKHHFLMLIQSKDYKTTTAPLSIVDFYNELFKMGHRGPESVAAYFAATWKDTKDSELNDLVAAVNWLGIEAKEKPTKVPNRNEKNAGTEGEGNEKPGEIEDEEGRNKRVRTEPVEHEQALQAAQCAAEATVNPQNERKRDLERNERHVKDIQAKITPENLMYLLLASCPPSDHTPSDLTATLAQRAHFVMKAIPLDGAIEGQVQIRRPFLKGIAEAKEEDENYAELCALRVLQNGTVKNDANLIPRLNNNNVYVAQAQGGVKEESLTINEKELLSEVKAKTRLLNNWFVEEKRAPLAHAEDSVHVESLFDKLFPNLQLCSLHCPTTTAPAVVEKKMKRVRSADKEEAEPIDWGAKLRQCFNVSDEYVPAKEPNGAEGEKDEKFINKVQYVLHCTPTAARNFLVKKNINKRQVNAKLLPPNVGIILCNDDGKVFDGVVPIGQRVAHHMNNNIIHSPKFTEEDR